MIKIASDNKAIEKCIRRLEKNVLDHNGWLDSDLVIRCEGGELSIEKHSFFDPRSPLIAVPQEMLLPTDKMKMAAKGDDLIMQPEDGALTPLQTDTAETMLELYNLTDKLKLHRESCCWLSFRENIEALDAILEARSIGVKAHEYYKFAKGESDINLSVIECDSYIKTRTIGLKNVKGAEPNIIHTYLMPIIDFMNHHVNGANFNLSKGEEPPEVDKFMQVRDSRPILNSHECYAYYNMLDTVDTFINYGFPDNSAPYVRSVPLQIDLGDAGKLVINSLSQGLIRQRLHKTIAGLRPYIPNTIRNEDGLLEVSHMVIPSMMAAPNAMRRVLRMLISGKAARIFNTNQVWEKVLEAEDTIMNANITFYDNLYEKADKALATSSDKHWELTRHIASTQKNVLSKYLFEAEHFGEKEIFDPEHQEDIPSPTEAVA